MVFELEHLRTTHDESVKAYERRLAVLSSEADILTKANLELRDQSRFQPTQNDFVMDSSRNTS